MRLQNKKVLVTGGAGFIGSNLVDQLVAQGNEVVVLDDLSTGKRENLRDAEKTGAVRFIEGSILDESLLKQACDGVNVVFHLAVQCLRICFAKPTYVHEVNATGTLELLKVAQAEKSLERFIYVSSSEVYGTALTAPMSEEHPLEPTTVYGASKLAGELYTQAFRRTYDMPTTVVRPFNSYGYREHHEGASGEVIPRFVVRILNNLPPIVFGDGDQTRDFTFVVDTATGLVRIAEAEALVGKTVNLAYGREVSIIDIAHKLLKLLGKENLGVEFQAERPADVRRHYADTSLLTNTIGFRPEVDIDTGLSRYISWFSEHNTDASKLLGEFATNNWVLQKSQEAVKI